MRRHWLRALLILAGVVAAWGVLGALFLPGYFRSRLEQYVSQATRGSLSIGRLTVNPFILAAGIHDFALLGPERDTLLAASEFTLDASITSIARRGIVLDRIALAGPEIHLTILPDGSLDWMRLIRPQTEPRPAGAPAHLPSVRIRRLTLQGGRLLFADRSHPALYSATVTPISLDLERFSTERNEQGDHSFTASLLEGGTLHWQGRFSVQPQAATGRIEVDSLSARALWRWLRSELRFEVPSGRLFVSLPYTLTTEADHPRLRIADGRLRASDVRIVEPGREGDVVAIPSLAAEGVAVDFVRSEATLARVHAEGARLLTSLAPDTVFNLARLFEPRTPPRPASGAALPDWRVRLARFDVSGVAVSLTDSTQRPAPTLDFTDLAFETRDLDSARPLSGQISARSKIAETGTLAAEGHASLAPLFVDLAIHAQRVPLRPVQAYIDSFIKLDIVRGNADLDGRLKAGGTSGGQLTFSLRADGQVHRLVAADSASGADFLRLAEAKVKGVELDFVPDRFRLRSLDLVRPEATVALGTDASLNLFRIFPALVPPPPGQVTKAVPFSIDRIGVRHGTMHFLDHTVKPPYASSIDSIQGTIENLSSSPAAEAHVTLTGRANGTGGVKLDARLRPADKEPYAIFTLGLSSYEMTALTPYVGKYLGRWVDRGQMSLDLDYRIENRKLKGKNDALLDQFSLGEKSNSPVATKLPVRLALALLRDRQGRISLDLPVKGDLDDPHFSIGGVILQALVNLVTKLAMSPFALLGHLIPGGGGDELGQVTFAPGVDTLSSEQAEQLGKLVSALSERPELRLYVTGAADSILDRASLARAGLELRIERQRRAEFFAAGVPEPEQAAQAPLPSGERSRALAKLYLETFGRDSLGMALPKPELSKGDLRRIAKRAIAGQTSGAASWPPKPLAEGTEARMEQRLLGRAVVGQDDLRKLADARAATLKHQLVDVRGLPDARVFLRGTALVAEPSKNQVVCRLDLTE